MSRTAKIPSGWEVVLDLIGRLAAIEEADVGDDPLAWYEPRVGEQAGYSKIPGRLADGKTASRFSRTPLGAPEGIVVEYPGPLRRSEDGRFGHCPLQKARA